MLDVRCYFSTGDGGLLIGRGTQQRFGSFGGLGFENTAGWLVSLGLEPAAIGDNARLAELADGHRLERPAVIACLAERSPTPA